MSSLRCARWCQWWVLWGDVWLLCLTSSLEASGWLAAGNHQASYWQEPAWLDLVVYPCLAPLGSCRRVNDLASPWLVPPHRSLAGCAYVSCSAQQSRVSGSDLSHFWGLLGHLDAFRANVEVQVTTNKWQGKSGATEQVHFLKNDGAYVYIYICIYCVF